MEVKDGICIDIGSSTGGFTDCLLKSGAKQVFAVDVGFGLLDYKLRSNPQVTVLEKTNARHLTREVLSLHGSGALEISLLVADISFISLIKVIEPLSHVLKGCKDWVLLFKPQFEVEARYVEMGGLVTDQSITKKAIDAFDTQMEALGFLKAAPTEESPITGKKSGNIEYLLHYRRDLK